MKKTGRLAVLVTMAAFACGCLFPGQASAGLFSGRGAAKAEKEWTVMVYCAADNDLAPFGLIDINEMEMVGSTDDVNVIVQFDGSKKYTPKHKGSCRYYIEKDDNPDEITSPVVKKLGEVDMGSRKTLRKFIEWGIKKYPARKYMVVLWNHGSGWYQSIETAPIDFTSPSDVQAIIDAVNEIQGGQGGKEALDRYIASRRLYQHETPQGGLFPVKPESAPDALDESSNGAIAVDEGGLFKKTTALSTTDVREALSAAASKLRRGQRIEVIGFDACLMGMVEVLHELRDQADWAVASQKTEPGDGWPYDKFLAKLAANPSMDGGELGRIIVDEYTEHYKNVNAAATNPFRKSNCTLAVCDLRKVADLTSALGELGRTLSKPELRQDVWKGVMVTQHMGEIAQTDPYVLLQLTAHRDVVHFAQTMKALASTGGAGQDGAAIVAAADKVIAAHNACVTHFGLVDDTPLLSMENAHGLAVMIPFLKIEPNYTQLQFGNTEWLDFLKFFKANDQERKQLIAIMTGQAGKSAADKKARKNFSAIYGE